MDGPVLVRVRDVLSPKRAAYLTSSAGSSSSSRCFGSTSRLAVLYLSAISANGLAVQVLKEVVAFLAVGVSATGRLAVTHVLRRRVLCVLIG